MPRFKQVAALAVVAVLFGLSVYLVLTRISVREAQELCSRQWDPVDRPQQRLFRNIRFEMDFYGMTYRGESGNYIDDFVLAYGAYEKDVLYFLSDALRALEPDGGVFVDVGANTGHHSLYMSRYAATVHAVEPFEGVLERFRVMVKLNGIKNITIHAVGLGDRHHELEFYEPPPDNVGAGTFVREFSSKGVATQKLKIVPGDDIFSGEFPIAVHIMKIDIEGFEKPALKGLQKTLASNRPVVVVEMSVARDLEKSFKGEQELRSVFPAGYEFYRFIPEKCHIGLGRYVLEPFDFDFQLQRQIDLVAFPTERKPSIPLTNAERIDPDERARWERCCQ